MNLAAPERLLLPFLMEPAPELLERHRRRGTAHGALISDILNLLSGGPGEPRGYGGTGGPPYQGITGGSLPGG